MMIRRPRQPARQPDVILQGAYYAITGIWSLLGIKSFQKVTGPKTDTWLVKTVGALVLVIGLVMAYTGMRRRHSPEIDALAAGAAAALMLVDWVYVAQGRISRVYLLDFLAEAGLLGAIAARMLRSAR